jgi:hypothetical protein
MKVSFDRAIELLRAFASAGTWLDCWINIPPLAGSAKTQVSEVSGDGLSVSFHAGNALDFHLSLDDEPSFDYNDIGPREGKFKNRGRSLFINVRRGPAKHEGGYVNLLEILVPVRAEVIPICRKE